MPLLKVCYARCNSPLSHVAVWKLPEGWRHMETQRYSVYNKTRGTYLCPEDVVVDTTLESLNSLLNEISDSSESGIWLAPFRGIPAGLGLRPIDLADLDGQNQVAQTVESFSAARPVTLSKCRFKAPSRCRPTPFLPQKPNLKINSLFALPTSWSSRSRSLPMDPRLLPPQTATNLQRKSPTI